MPDATIYDRCAIIRANAPNFKDEMATVIILEVLDRIDELRPRGWPIDRIRPGVLERLQQHINFILTGDTPEGYTDD